LKSFARPARVALSPGLPSTGMRRGLEVTENDIASIWNHGVAPENGTFHRS